MSAALGIALAILVAAPAASAAPQNVLAPLLTCVDVNGDGSVTAHFGFENTWPNAVSAPAGKSSGGLQNFFTPSPADRGQPSRFASGRSDDLFTVTFTEPLLTWALGDDNGTVGSVTASAGDTRCISVPAAGPGGPGPVLAATLLAGIALSVLGRRPRTATIR